MLFTYTYPASDDRVTVEGVDYPAVMQATWVDHPEDWVHAVSVTVAFVDGTPAVTSITSANGIDIAVLAAIPPGRAVDEMLSDWRRQLQMKRVGRLLGTIEELDARTVEGQVEAAAMMVGSGATMEDISSTLGVSLTTAWRRVQRAADDGLVDRSKLRKRGRRAVASDTTPAAILAANDAGETISAIAARLGISESTVKNRLREARS